MYIYIEWVVKQWLLKHLKNIQKWLPAGRSVGADA